MVIHGLADHRDPSLAQLLQHPSRFVLLTDLGVHSGHPPITCTCQEGFFSNV